MDKGQIKYLNIAHLAIYLGMSKSYFYKNWPAYVTDNRIRTYRIGKKILFNRDDVDKAMERKFKS